VLGISVGVAEGKNLAEVVLQVALSINVERPATIMEGTNRLVHITADNILMHYCQIMDGGAGSSRRIPELWEGRAADRIAGIITEA
jgi:UDP-N-acetylglucosamine 2-epimerase (non-hydrolysing)